MEEELNTATPDHYYQMQIAAEVRRVLSSKPGNIKVGDFKLRFDRKAPQKLNVKARAKRSLEHWKSVVGKSAKDQQESGSNHGESD